MIPHIQTNTDENTGSCFATCIASILDLPLEDVPNFRQLQEELPCYDMTAEADKWLREKFGKRFICIAMYHVRGTPKQNHPNTEQPLCNRLAFSNKDELVILSGESPRKNSDGSTRYHAVVGRADMWGFELVHDPHPDGTGIIGEPYSVKWIVPV